MQFKKLSQKEYKRLSQEEKQKYREAEVQNIIKDKTFIVKPFVYQKTQKETFLNCVCLLCNTEWMARYDTIVSKGTGCRQCLNNSFRLDEEEIKRRLDKTSKGRWTYRFLKPYKKYNDIIEITCNTCGNVEYPKINNIVNHNKGCIKCNKVATPTYEEIIKQLDKVAKEGNYTYKKFQKEEYENVTNLKVECKCDICGHEWKARATSLKGKRKTKCKKCAGKNIGNILRLSKEEVIKRLEESSKGRYTWDTSNYKSVLSLIKCKCTRCGYKWSSSYIVLTEKYTPAGCPKCDNIGTSNAEKEIVNFIKTFYSGKIITSDRKTIKSPTSKGFYEIDILLPEINLAFEYNGIYWHSDKIVNQNSKGYFKTADEKHQYKTNECKKLGITLLHIAEEDYIKDKEKVLKKLKENIIKTIDK